MQPPLAARIDQPVAHKSLEPIFLSWPASLDFHAPEFP
jgi:hypothetical protein